MTRLSPQMAAVLRAAGKWGVLHVDREWTIDGVRVDTEVWALIQKRMLTIRIGHYYTAELTPAGRAWLAAAPAAPAPAPATGDSGGRVTGQ